MFTCVLWRYVVSTVILVPKPLEGTDRVAGQLRRDKECPFCGVTKSSRVWRKVPKSDAQSVDVALTWFLLTVMTVRMWHSSCLC